MSGARESEEDRRERVAREMRLRRSCSLNGLSLARSRRRTALAPDLGLYRLKRGATVVFESFELADIEEHVRRLAQAARTVHGGCKPNPAADTPS